MENEITFRDGHAMLTINNTSMIFEKDELVKKCEDLLSVLYGFEVYIDLNKGLEFINFIPNVLDKNDNSLDSLIRFISIDVALRKFFEGISELLKKKDTN
jgi:hypothetical protein